MNIRQKLTFQFLLIVSVIFVSASATVYIFSVDYRKDNFYERITSKASNTAKLLISVDEVDMPLLRKIEENNPTTLPYEKITIYNSANEILFTTDKDSFLKISTIMLDSIHVKKEIRFTKDSFEIVGFVFDGKTKNNIVIAGAVDIFGKRRLRFLSDTLYYVTIMSLVLVFVSGWFFAGQALSPIKTIVSKVDEISINKLSLRLEEGKGKDELSLLAKTFNRMLEGLEESFLIQKNFIANASHELRTPLTAITGQLEVELMRDRTPEEYKEALQSVLEDMKNLNAISNRLLLLTQASTENSQMQFAPLRVDDIVWFVKNDLEKQNPQYQVLVDFDEQLTESHMLTISGNAELLKIALINLADNGCKYSPDHKVQVKLHPENKKLIIRFTDTGIGVEKSDLPLLFEPFYRGKNAIGYKGHGIGLSLVKRIITMHRGTIQVTSILGNQTVFTISLPWL